MQQTKEERGAAGIDIRRGEERKEAIVSNRKGFFV